MILATIAAATTLAQAGTQAPKAMLQLDQESAVSGSLVTGSVTLEFAPGLHAYQNPPSLDYQIPVSVKPGDELNKIIKVRYPAGEAHTVGGEVTPSYTYSGTVTIPVAYRLTSKTGEQTVAISVRYQQCTDEACFPPSTITVESKINVTPAPTGWSVVKQRTNEALVLSKFLQPSE